MRKTILSLAAMLLIACSASNEVTAANVSNAGKTLDFAIAQNMTDKLYITIDNKTLPVTLVDNAATLHASVQVPHRHDAQRI